MRRNWSDDSWDEQIICLPRLEDMDDSDVSTQRCIGPTRPKARSIAFLYIKIFMFGNTESIRYRIFIN
jgi:hypothetical protein